MKTIVQFGAGCIGRSLVGTLFHTAGWRIVFVDADETIVAALKNRSGYLVRIREHTDPDADETIPVGNFDGLHASETEAITAAVREADLLSTAVGGATLPKVIGAMAPGLHARTRPVSVLLCENLRQSARVAAAVLAKTERTSTPRVGFVETSIGKMVPIMPARIRERDPLEVWSERYNRIVADRNGFVDEPPAVPELVLKKDFAAHVDCKLFVHNLGHAAAAYHGFLRGFGTIPECLADPAVRAEASGAMDESVLALIRAYAEAFTLEELRAHRDELLRRFDNPALGDTVFRVGRDLPRKLAPDDRCFGALALALRTGVDPEHVCRTIAAALHFRATDEAGAPFPADAIFLRQFDNTGHETFLRAQCRAAGIATGEEIVARILRYHTTCAPAK